VGKNLKRKEVMQIRLELCFVSVRKRKRFDYLLNKQLPYLFIFNEVVLH